MPQKEFNSEKSNLMPGRKKTSFTIDALKLVSGTTFTSIIGFVTAPLLTRLYSPSDFGISSLFTSITGILVVIACLRYELSIMLPENDDEAANMLGISMTAALLVSLLTIPAVVWWHQPILRWLNATELTSYIWLIPPMVLFGGFFTALNYWNSRTKKFGRLSIARVTKSIAKTSAELGAGYAGYANGGTLVSANVFSQALSTIILGVRIWYDDSRLFFESVNWQDMLSGVKRFRKFPIYSSLSALMNSFSWQLPIFLLSNYFSSTIVGFYSLSFRIVSIPMSLIGGAIAQVFFQRASEAKAEGNLALLVEKVFRQLVLFCMYPLLLLTIIGRDLFTFVFGAGWAEAGVYAQILSVWAFFWFISSVLSNISNVLEKQKFGTIWSLGLLLSRLFSLGIGGYIGNVYLALVLFSITGIIMYVILFIVQIGWLSIDKSNIVKIIFSQLITSVIVLSPTILVKLFNSSTIVLFLSVMCSTLLYGIYILKQSESFQIVLKHKNN